jgi:uncharacterized protein YggE
MRPAIISAILLTCLVAWANATALTIVGVGNALARADQTQVRLAIRRQARTAALAQSSALRDLQNVQEALQAAKARNVRNSGVTLYPTINGTRIVGYESMAGVVFEIAAEGVGRALDRAVRAGTNHIESVQSFVDPRGLSRAQARALRLAVADAESKAILLASAMGICIATPTAVTTQNDQGAVGPGLLIASGQEYVAATVTAVYASAPCAETSAAFE